MEKWFEDQEEKDDWLAELMNEWMKPGLLVILKGQSYFWIYIALKNLLLYHFMAFNFSYNIRASQLLLLL